MRNILRIKINKKTFEDAWALGKTLIFFTIFYTKQMKSAAACIICYK